MAKNKQVTDNKWYMLESHRTNTIMASVLSFWAGNVNGLTTISVFFERSSHVSGRIADIGINLVFMPIDALFVTVIWLSFVMGSYFAGVLLDRIGLTRSLVLQSICILLAAIAAGMGIPADVPEGDWPGRILMAFILPFSMGFQNSLTSQLPLDRTTHWTGLSTDLGIALAKGSYSKAVSICVRIFAFIIGAAVMSYLIGVINMPPFYGLLSISAGLMLTAFAGDRFNKKFISSRLITTSENETGKTADIS